METMGTDCLNEGVKAQGRVGDVGAFVKALSTWLLILLLDKETIENEPLVRLAFVGIAAIAITAVAMGCVLLVARILGGLLFACCCGRFFFKKQIGAYIVLVFGRVKTIADLNDWTILVGNAADVDEAKFVAAKLLTIVGVVEIGELNEN